MASVEEALYTVLSGSSSITNLVSTRIYPNYAPESAALPFLVYTEVSALRDHTHGGASGYVDSRYQVSCFDDDYTGCRTLANAVRNLLDDYSNSTTSVSITRIIIDSEVDIPTFPPELNAAKVHGKALDFRIWFTE